MAFALVYASPDFLLAIGGADGGAAALATERVQCDQEARETELRDEKSLALNLAYVTTIHGVPSNLVAGAQEKRYNQIGE
jgi:hypothetical protein